MLLIAREGDAVGKERELCGGEGLTTNNRMELLAAISALEALAKPSEITVVTDSAYVKNGVTEWIHSWKRNGWRTAGKDPVKNAELWQGLTRRRRGIGSSGAGSRAMQAMPRTSGRMRWRGRGWHLSSRRAR